MPVEERFDGYAMPCCGRVFPGATCAPGPDVHDCRAFDGLTPMARERFARARAASRHPEQAR